MANFVEFEYKGSKIRICVESIAYNELNQLTQPRVEGDDNWQIRISLKNNPMYEYFYFKTQSEAQELYDKLRGKTSEQSSEVTWEYPISEPTECLFVTTSPVIDSDEELISILRDKLCDANEKLDKIRSVCNYIEMVLKADDEKFKKLILINNSIIQIKAILEEKE